MSRLAFVLSLALSQTALLAQSSSPKRIPPHPALVRIESEQVIISRFLMEVSMPADEKPGSPRLPGLELRPKGPLFYMKASTKSFPANQVKGYTPRGERIGASELRRKLKKDTLALVSLDGKPVDPFYLQLITDDTIVLVPPAIDPHYNVKFPGIAPPK